MANRYRKRQSRSRTPEPTSVQNPAWMPPNSPRLPRARMARRSLGGWGSLGNLDQIMNTLQESIQQKQKECYSSFESLDNLSDEDDDSGIRMTDDPSTSKWRDAHALFGAKDDLPADYVDDAAVRLPRRKPESRSVHGSRENLTDRDPDFRTARRMLPTVNPVLSGSDEECLKNKVNALLGSGLDGRGSDSLQDGSPHAERKPSSNPDTTTSPNAGPVGARIGRQSEIINGNWIMKAAVRDPDESVIDDSPFDSQLDSSGPSSPRSSNDVNNNHGSDSSPRFVKNPNLTVSRRSEVNTRRRSRWDCTSPVTIKLQDSKTEVVPSRGRVPDVDDDVTGSRPLPAYRRSKSEDGIQNASTRKPKPAPRNAKPSPTVPPNTKFRQGFMLNAQRKLASRTEAPAVSGDASKPEVNDRTPKSKWEQTQVGPSILFDNSAEEQLAGGCGGNDEKTGGTMLFISSKDDVGGEKKKKGGDEVMADDARAGRKPDEASPNRSYEAFFVSCGDESTPAAAGMTDEDRGIRLPQWVIPFIDDDLTGRFECGPAGRRVAGKASTPPSVDRRKAAASPGPGGSKSPGVRSSGPGGSKSPGVGSSGTGRSKSPGVGSSGTGRSKSPGVGKLAGDSSPVPPPRMKRTAAMNRILKERDELACRERPLPDRPDRSKAAPTVRLPERVKSPTRTAKKPPTSRPPSESGSLSADSSEVESFPVHHVQHSKGPTVPLTKGVSLRTAGGQKSTETSALGHRSRAASRPDLSRAGLALAKPTTPSSALKSKRSKSVDNLTLLSSSSVARDKDVTRGGRQTGRTPTRMTEPASGKTGTPAPNENRAMKALREAMSSKGRGAGSEPSRRPANRTQQSGAAAAVRREPLTSTSSTDSATAGGRTSARRSTPRDEPTAGSRTRFERLDSTDSEESSAGPVERRVTTARRTPVRRSVSLKERSRVRIDDDADYAVDETLTLPRRRSRVEKASLHDGGYGTLRKVETTAGGGMPKKSILKKRSAVTVSRPGPDVTTEPGDEEPKSTTTTTRSGRRVLPPPPDDADVDLRPRLFTQSWISTSVDNLNLPSQCRSRVGSSASSSDGSILGLRRTAFTSSRESLFKRSGSRDDDGLASSRPSSKEKPTTERCRTPRKSSLSSSRESIAKSSEPKTGSAAAGRSNKTTRQRSLSASRENLLRKSASRESLSSDATSRKPLAGKNGSPRDNSSPRSLVSRKGAVSSTKSEASPQNRTPDKWNKAPSVATSGGRQCQQTALSRTGLHPVDSIKKHKKTLRADAGSREANHKMSDRFRKLVEGDIDELTSPATSGGKTATLSERENSFDSGVEFIMHL